MVSAVEGEEAVSNSKNGTDASSKDDPIPPSSLIVVCSPSMRAVLLAHALALPDEVDQKIRHEVIDDNNVGDDDRSRVVIALDIGEIFQQAKI